LDRGGRLAGALSAASAALLLLAAADSPRVPIREARWAAPDRLFETLSREPAECLARPVGAAARRSVEIGRIAFRAPLLLGGQAARAGISCATCHRSGRDNPAFLFPGVSGDPGTADVTSSLMSSHRGDRTDNPRPIPDLAGPPERLKVSRTGPGALEAFIHGLVVEEFDGAEPPPAVMAGLAAYVRALRPEACRGGSRRVSLEGRLDAVAAAVRLAAGSDRDTGRFLITAARSLLGAVDERFRLPGLERDRALLAEADAELRALREDPRRGAPSLERWLERWPERRRRLMRDERRSLFSPAILRAQLRA